MMAEIPFPHVRVVRMSVRGACNSVRIPQDGCGGSAASNTPLASSALLGYAAVLPIEYTPAMLCLPLQALEPQERRAAQRRVDNMSELLLRQ